MLKKTPLAFALTMLAFTAFGQSIKIIKSSVGTGAIHSTSGKFYISSIVGQPSPVSQISSGSFHLLQGFQSPLFSHQHSFFKSVAPTAFPNPTRGKFWLKWLESENEIVTIDVVDNLGHIRKNETVSRDGSEIPLDYSDLISGLYHLRISGQRSGKYVIKLLIL